MNEYLAIDSGGYFLTNSICIFITAWPDASQRSRDGVWLNRSTMGVMCNTLYELAHDWLLVCITTCVEDM